MVALLFPGQGSQFVGMGRDLAERYPAAREVFEVADRALEIPLTRMAWEGPEEELTRTENAQPAILAHSIAVFRVLEEVLGDVRLAAGHSLGEFSAYVAAGTLPLEAGLRLVRRRGQLMARSGAERPGTMAAIVGLESHIVEALCRDAAREGGECVAANYNAPNQVVISGDIPTVHAAMERARAEGAKRVVPLNVSGAFHSPLMQPAQPGLQAELGQIELRTPRFPVVSNVTAEPVSDLVSIRRLLLEQLTSPVRWVDGIRTMVGHGVTRYFELGPGSVLTGLARRVAHDAEVRSLGSADEVAALLATG